MEFVARVVEISEIRPLREQYREEMNCQIIHESIHERPGWSVEYLLSVDGSPAGYGSVAVRGPWTDEPTLYELFVEREARPHLIELSAALLEASGAKMIEVQSNDRQSMFMLHAFVRDVESQATLFEDGITTNLRANGATFRLASRAEMPEVPEHQLRWHAVLEVEDQVAASGGVLFHYNPPYGDIFMDVAEPFRGRGLGSFLVQELKRLCYEGGHVPAARCKSTNVASRRTLQKAGFVPCGHLVSGPVYLDALQRSPS